MRPRNFVVALTLLAFDAGCRQIPTRMPPAPPNIVADASATGGRKVIFEEMRRMAEEDARTVRK